MLSVRAGVARGRFRLRVLRARLDPGARRWAEAMRADARSGRLRAALATQPTPEEIIRQWRAGELELGAPEPGRP